MGHGGTVIPDQRSPHGLWRRTSLKTARSPSPSSSRSEKGLSFCDRESCEIWSRSICTGLMMCPLRLPSRRKHEVSAPVAESSEARQKFSNAKAISSDMFFGRESNPEVPRGQESQKSLQCHRMESCQMPHIVLRMFSYPY